MYRGTGTDGHVCSIFAGIDAGTVAGQLRDTLVTAGACCRLLPHGCHLVPGSIAGAQDYDEKTKRRTPLSTGSLVDDWKVGRPRLWLTSLRIGQAGIPTR